MMGNDIIFLCCYPDTETRLNILRDLVKNIRSSVSLPILLSSHLPVPSDVMEQVDYFIYEKDDAPSENYTVFYHYTIPNDLHIKTKRSMPYHALSGYTSLKSGTTFLRNKFQFAHLLQYDTTLDFQKYISIARKFLKKHKFVGSEYKVPNQNLSGICGAFFSYDVKWLDNKLPEIRTWDEWKSYGRDEGDNLMGENWLHNFWTDHDMMSSCYFLSSQESGRCAITCDVQTRGNQEPGLHAYLSELEDHRLILFLHLHEKGILNFAIDHNGRIENHVLNGGQVHWVVIDKLGYITVKTVEQCYGFVIDPTKEYTDTVFKFTDNKMKCLRECE